MHQQYRLRLATGDTSDTPGAAPLRSTELDPIRARPGALAQLAATIAEAGINLRSVGGEGIELGGEVSLAVSDEDEERFAQLLEEKGYSFRVVEPPYDHLQDRPGALADFLGKLAGEGRLIDSINVATPDKDGTIPVQARTVQVSTGSGATTAGQVAEHGKHEHAEGHGAERGSGRG